MRRSDYACNDNNDNEEEDKNGPWFCMMMVYAMISVMMRMWRERVQDRVGRYATAFCLAAFCLEEEKRRKGR